MKKIMRNMTSAAPDDPRLLQAALDYSSDAIILFECLRDRFGNMQALKATLANHKAAELIGQSVETIISKTSKSLFPSALAESIWERAVHVVANSQTSETQIPFTIHDGRTGWFSMLITRHGDGISLSLRDITDARYQEQEVERVIAELRQSNKNLEQFAYVASHDLQEPLRKILAFGEVLHTQFGDMLGKDGNGLIDRMQSAAHRMETLIKGLLTFSRLTARQEPFERVSMQLIMSEVLSDLETTINEQKAVIDLTELPTVMGDALQIQQLFQNLLTNALKFSCPDQTPHIRIDCELMAGRAIQTLPGQVVAEGDLNRSFYAISVTDNGIGFDEKYRLQIFTIFQRLHGRSRYQGTGIGLAVVQKVVENHKGYIHVRSQPGQGASFTIFWPQE